jgi:hypothetical protein
MRTIPRFRLLFFATEQKREIATSGPIQNNNKKHLWKGIWHETRPWLIICCMYDTRHLWQDSECGNNCEINYEWHVSMLLRNLTPINFDEKKYCPKNPYCISLIIQLCKVCCTNPVLYPCIYKDVKNAFKYKNREKKSDINNTS